MHRPGTPLVASVTPLLSPIPQFPVENLDIDAWRALCYRIKVSTLKMFTLCFSIMEFSPVCLGDGCRINSFTWIEKCVRLQVQNHWHLSSTPNDLSVRPVAYTY